MLATITPARKRCLGAVALMGLLAFPWVAWPVEDASANHPWFTSDPKHLYYEHWDSAGHGTLDEDFCADDLSGSIGDANLYNMVYDTFISQSPRWDRMNGSDYRVDLWGIDVNSVGPCGAIDLSTVELQVRASDPGSWCGSSTSCVDFAVPVPTVSPRHFQQGIMYMAGAHVPLSNPSEYRRNINHEAGHIWGLKDPDFVNQYSGGCFASWGVGYYSVMHQYSVYCNTSGGYSIPYIVQPQGADYENVIAFQLPSH